MKAWGGGGGGPLPGAGGPCGRVCVGAPRGAGGGAGPPYPGLGRPPARPGRAAGSRWRLALKGYPRPGGGPWPAPARHRAGWRAGHAVSVAGVRDAPRRRRPRCPNGSTPLGRSHCRGWTRRSWWHVMGLTVPTPPETRFAGGGLLALTDAPGAVRTMPSWAGLGLRTRVDGYRSLSTIRASLSARSFVNAAVAPLRCRCCA